MLEHGLAPTTGGYEIANSLRFNDNDSAYLSWTPSSAGNQKTFTWSGWVKRGNLSTEQHPFLSAGSNSSNYVRLGRFNTNDTINIYSISGGSDDFEITTTQVFRDVSAWYHIVFAVDTTQATASNRVKLYVNGEQITNFSTASYPSQNFDFDINNTSSHYIGRRLPASSSFHDGYLAEVNFIDGQALDPSNFGESGAYGEWKPIKYTGAYGVNGFYLDFSNSGSLGADSSGNSNNWTPTNLAATDQMLDSPTNNFATLNPLAFFDQNVNLSEGNLRLDWDVNGEGGAAGTFSMFDGSYVEVYVLGATGDYPQLGVTDLNNTGQAQVKYNWGAYVNANGTSGIIGTTTGVTMNGSPSTSSYTTGDIIQIAYKNGKVYIGKNNSWMNSGNPTSETGQIINISSGTLVAIANRIYSTGEVIYNFGQDSSFAGNKTAQGNTDGNGYGDFYYTPPTGYLALCTQNLPDATVIPSEHFNTVLYTGTGADQSITGVGFQPDWVWLKMRSSTGSHGLFDAVRGATKRLSSNLTAAEDTAAGVNSFDSDGFTLDALNWNDSGGTYVAWNWKANGAGVSNTDGTITSTVSANTSAGFSIVSYTGNVSTLQTVGHGLTSAPEMIICKCRTSTDYWGVYHKDVGTDGFMRLDSTAAKTTFGDAFPVVPTSSVFTIDNWDVTNRSGGSQLAYAFHSVDGFSKVGSYTGNGSTDGPFVYTGFQVKWVMYKRTDLSGDWSILDTERSTYNVADDYLYPHSSAAEASGAYQTDFLSNGFKLRGTNTQNNASGSTYMYIAFAENPFKNTNAR